MGGFGAKHTDAQIAGVHGRALNVASGSIVLLPPDGKPVAKYIADHNERIMALSIEVSDLAKARRIAESAQGKKLATYDGSFGKSFLLPPTATHGFWLELFQKSNAVAGHVVPISGH
jgi:hypothetical protein